VRQPDRYFLRRTIILGISIFSLSIVSGVAVMFWPDYGYLRTMSRSEASQLLLQSIAGPLYLGVVFLFPITIFVLLASVTIVSIGFLSRRIWLSLIAFLLMGSYWVWLVKLIAGGALD
jgi:hypothetical protein